MKRFLEKLAEGALLLSGSITSITILLIVLFLFKEASGLFRSPVIEEGYVIALNKANTVKSLSSYEIKEIFDGEISNWAELGGKDEAIEVVRLSDLTNYYTEEELGAEFENIPAKASELTASHPGIVLFLPKQYLAKKFDGITLDKETIHPGDFFGGKEWYPTASPSAQFGLLPLLLGTLWVSLGAILLSLPFGIAVAVYLAEIATMRVRNILKPIIELLAGIPSVVYGFFGLVVLVPFLQKIFQLPVGETALAGSVVLAIMALPTIITVAEDAMRTTPRAMKEASLALGATHWQTIYKVIIPYSKSGITSAAVLGIGRAIGETMAVLMVTGNAAVIPHTLLEPVRTIPATIAAELGEAASGSAHYQALFALGCILFLITMVLSISVEFISKKQK
ncbi:MAG: phosphate ABC transporter permease subunit PstC [Bacteroidales bacterium]|nr:phosphate ABC transporter permease subunit PstC [Bacteroidales bacterium]